MTLPDFAVDWLRASWSSHESALSTARKNAKSAIAAVLALGYLCGPLRRPGWRGAIASSLDKEKAGGATAASPRRLPRRPSLDIRRSGARHIRASSNQRPDQLSTPCLRIGRRAMRQRV